jgi:hypothetical protein
MSWQRIAHSPQRGSLDFTYCWNRFSRVWGKSEELRANRESHSDRATHGTLMIELDVLAAGFSMTGQFNQGNSLPWFLVASPRIWGLSIWEDPEGQLCRRFAGPWKRWQQSQHHSDGHLTSKKLSGARLGSIAGHRTNFSCHAGCSPFDQKQLGLHLCGGQRSGYCDIVSRILVVNTAQMTYFKEPMENWTRRHYSSFFDAGLILWAIWNRCEWSHSSQ